MNKNKSTNPPPHEPSYYQTGSTRPRKSRSGIIALLVAIVIALGGIVSALGLLNIHLFQKISAAKNYVPFSFSETQPAATEEDSAATAATVSGDASIHLSQTPQSIENIPQTGGLSLQSIYEKNIPSVVSITCDAGTGTGVVFSTDGYIVTNAHVVNGSHSIQALLTDGRSLNAQLVGVDTVSDLAVLQVDATDLLPAEFGNSDELRVGDAVVAIGDPLGIALRGTMTDGIVSAINRNITTGGRTMTLIQTNAALNTGNSGGPLLNCYGQVIGINTVKIGDNMSVAGVEGLGFAIPSTTVKEIVDQLLSQGYVSGRPSLGITGEDISTFDRLYYRLPLGIYITDATGDAAEKGISAGDILLQIDGIAVTSVEEAKTVLAGYTAGDTVTLVIYRGGNQYAVPVVLSEAK